MASSWGIETYRASRLRGAQWRCFVSWSLKVQENAGCKRLTGFGQAFFRVATASFRRADTLAFPANRWLIVLYSQVKFPVPRGVGRGLGVALGIAVGDGEAVGVGVGVALGVGVGVGTPFGVIKA